MAIADEGSDVDGHHHKMCALDFSRGRQDFGAFMQQGYACLTGLSNADLQQQRGPAYSLVAD